MQKEKTGGYGSQARRLTPYPLPTYMHHLLTDRPPYTEAPVSNDQSIPPFSASIAYMGPVRYVEPAKRTPLTTVTGLDMASFETAVAHSIRPV